MDCVIQKNGEIIMKNFKKLLIALICFGLAAPCVQGGKGGTPSRPGSQGARKDFRSKLDKRFERLKEPKVSKINVHIPAVPAGRIELCLKKIKQMRDGVQEMKKEDYIKILKQMLLFVKDEGICFIIGTVLSLVTPLPSGIVELIFLKIVTNNLFLEAYKDLHKVASFIECKVKRKPVQPHDIEFSMGDRFQVVCTDFVVGSAVNAVRPSSNPVGWCQWICNKVLTRCCYKQVSVYFNDLVNKVKAKLQSKRS